MPKDSKKYLLDIIQAIDLINDFTKDVKSFEEYKNDFKTQSAVERQLSIIGEAVVQFTKEHSLDHSNQIRGFRNRLIHSYDSVDETMIWSIVKLHLPNLYSEVTKKLKD